MSTLRLNAVTVRSNDLPVKPPGRSSLDEALAQPLLMTRRQLLAAAGAAVAVGAISTRTLEPLLETEAGAHARGAWLRAGSYRAMVDPSLFGGNPRLNVSRSGSWYAELRDALFPGTSLPAGVELAVLGSGTLARLRIRHDLGGFLAEVPLSGWLSGETPAKADVRLGEFAQPLGDGHTLRLAGLATATLAPDWSLRLEGRDIARLSGLGREIVADAVTIALATDTAPTLLSRRVARRTLITLEGDAKTWEIDAPTLSGGRSMSIAAGALDRITVEAAEARSGAVHRALVAFSTNGGEATFAPNTGFAADTDTLSLGSLRYARLLDGSGSYHLAADFAEPTWTQAYGHTLLVGGASWAAPFEVFGGAAGSTVNAEPAVKGLAAPFQGAIASPITFPEDARSTVRLGDAPKSMGAAALPITDTPFIPFPIPLQSYFTVTRPDDMLSLRFELYNLEFVSQSGGPSLLVRSSARQQAYLSVVFPGQHVLERAWMIQQTPGSAPYQAYLADESQLAFKVPSAVADKGIPFTMEGLLDWSQFAHNVVPAARATVELPNDMKRYMRMPNSGSSALGINPETYLEIPWGLYLSPEPDAFWTHRTQPMTSHSRTELWYTKLHGAYSSLPIFVVNGEETTKPDAQPNGKLKSAAIAAPGDVVIGPVDPGIFRPTFEKAPTLRAVWSRHYDVRLTSDNPIPDAPTDGLFRNSFTTNQQDSADIIVPSTTFPFIKIVKNDIGGIKHRWSITDLSGRYHDNPINVNHLLLTSMGAWMDSKAKWATDEIALTKSVATELLQWDHRMTMGRDQYVKIVLFGRLFPFGHKAVKVIITERKVRADSPFAFLEQRTYIMVREPTVTYSNDAAPINRSLPYKSVTLKTLQTPPVLEGTVAGVTLTEDAFWPRDVASGQDIQWQVEAADWDGNAKKFTMPLIFVRGFVAGKYDNIVNYSAAEPILTSCSNAVKLKQVDLAGQTVAYSKNVAGTNKDQARVLPTNWQRFEAGVYDPSTPGDARYYPKLYRANISLDALEEMTNQKAGTTIEIADQYKNLGFSGANAAGRVFAKIVTPPSVGFPAELSGALATPVPLFSGISANKGTFGGDLDQFGSGQYSPKDFFDQLNANLIGGITLFDVLGEVLGLDDMPVFEKVRDALDSDTLIVQFDWETPLTSSGAQKSELAGLFIAEAGAKLKLHAEIRKKLSDATAPPTSLVRGEMGPFTLQLVQPVFDAIHLKFSLLSFESVDGASPSVDPQISDVEFVGVLKYLSTLAKYLGSLGGVGGSSTALAKPAGPHALVSLVDSGPLKIDVTAAGITASLSLQLPDITVGVFSLKNMSFFAGLTLPFSGDPVTLDFAFCSRESPFELLVMGFGGGGYVLMQLDINGMRSLEISLEFGAGTSLDIGVASGSVEIKGGFTLRYERDVGLTFTMFIRIRGSLSVLGLITVTITFYLELEYRTFTCPNGADGDELTGTATLTIEIEILFFSTSVELSVTKTLAGSDPRFADLMPVKTDWDDYCAAFAPARLGA